MHDQINTSLDVITYLVVNKQMCTGFKIKPALKSNPDQLYSQLKVKRLPVHGTNHLLKLIVSNTFKLIWLRSKAQAHYQLTFELNMQLNLQTCS